MDDITELRIRQKVGAAQREAFRERYPGQVEHCLRLVVERLQACLVKRANTDPADPQTWAVSAGEIASLSQAARDLDEIYSSLRQESK